MPCINIHESLRPKRELSRDDTTYDAMDAYEIPRQRLQEEEEDLL